MAIKFNQTTTLDGLVQYYEKEMGYDYGFISGNTTRLRSFTARANQALDRYFALAIQASGRWELDDTNHGDFNNIYTTLTSGQRDYGITVDDNSAAILDVYKVLILPTSTSTEYVEVYPVDETSSEYISIISEGPGVGVPTFYGKRGNSIIFNVTPNYTATRGIKILVNRESHYFEYTDTTQTAGYPYHQEYFWMRPALEDGRSNMSDSQYTKLRDEVQKLEGDNNRVGLIQKAYGRRNRDEIDFISGESINSI